jgi:ElaB/YqjD/DUF883 family membrane-anchored ribosome-binding protein
MLACIEEASSYQTDGKELRMGMTEPVTATEAEVGQVTKEKLMEDLRAVVADAEELVKATDDSVRGNPWMAVGIAVAVGLILGILAARR